MKDKILSFLKTGLETLVNTNQRKVENLIKKIGIFLRRMKEMRNEKQ